MNLPYLAETIAVAAMAALSGIGKLRRDPKIVHVVHEVVGVPLNYFPLLAGCEIAGALGLVLGIWWPLLGIAAGIGLVVFFGVAIALHLRVGDVKGVGPASLMLILSVAAVALRFMAHGAGGTG